MDKPQVIPQTIISKIMIQQMEQRLIKILVVGQTPPPYGGQAVMIGKLLHGKYDCAQLYHIRMAFSKEMGQMGKFQISKIFHLIGIIARIYWCRFHHRIKILYYPPSGPVFNAVARDMLVLLLTRPLFEKTIFQFFAGGLTEIYSSLSPFFKFLFRLSFFHPDVSLQPSLYSPDDAAFIGSQKSYIVNWATDENYHRFKKDRNRTTGPEILFVGVLKESKGILILLEACSQLAKKGFQFTLNVMGQFESQSFKNNIQAFIERNHLSDRVRFLGVQTGDDYYRYYAQASIFCFPTFFESENVPIVTMDASEFALPIVSTRWRGVPSVVEDGVNGFLVPIRDAKAVESKLTLLLNDPDLRDAMGEKGRKIYLENFTMNVFCQRMNQVFQQL